MKKHPKESRGCCKDVAANVKLNELHVSSSVAFIIDFNSHIPYIRTAFIFLIPEMAKAAIFYKPHDGPPLRKIPLFLQHQNFRV